MSATSTTPPPRLSSERTWNLALLMAPEPGRRNRRMGDATLLVGASVLTALAAVVAKSAPGVDAEIADAVGSLLGWAPYLWRGLFVGALVLALVIVGDVVVQGRWLLARDVVLALAVVLLAGMILGRVVDSDWLEADVLVRLPAIRSRCG